MYRGSERHAAGNKLKDKIRGSAVRNEQPRPPRTFRFEHVLLPLLPSTTSSLFALQPVLIVLENAFLMVNLLRRAPALLHAGRNKWVAR